ncbi:MAG: type VI secretion system tip protein TssI/VgrG [Polyangiales bacterium]
MSDIFSIDSDALPPSTRVVAFEGTERLSTPYAITAWLLVASAEAEGLDLGAAVLRPGTLAVARDDGSPRWSLSGVFSELELVHEVVGGDALYRAVLAPRLWALSLSLHNRVWVDKTVPFVIEDVLRKAGYPSDGYDISRLTATYKPRPHLCQYRESDFDFISRVMEREGIYYFFEQTDAGERAVFVDDKGRHEDFAGGFVRMVPEAGGGDSGSEGFRSFAARASAASAEVRLRDHDPLAPTRDPAASLPVWAPGFGVLVRHQEEWAADASDASRLAQIRAQQDAAARTRVRGAGRVFDVRVGYTFTLEEHPRAALNGAYLCVAVTHHGRLLEGPDALARFIPVRGHRVYTAEVEATPKDLQYRAPAKTPVPRVHGVEVGRVDGPTDSDYAQVDEHGRYRVDILFDEIDHPGGVSSTWLRMIQPHAGAPEGYHFPLRKGTEVTVGFVGGDPDRPVILGAVPNAETPAAVTSDNHTHDVIHTGGDNRVEIEDTAGAQYIDISTPPERTFLHLGAHHGGHRHNYITSTDGNGLIHTGGVMNVTVGGEKHETVTGTVLEEYDQTQRTEVTGAVDEKYHGNQTTTVAHHCEETYLATQTTEVEAHTSETCTDQRTTVRGLCDEHHGTQTVTVDRLLKTHCDTELFDTGQGTHTDGTLAWTIHNGALIKAGTFLMTGPSFDMNVRTTHTITRPNEQLVDIGKNDFTPFKFEAALLSAKVNGMATTDLTAKVDILRNNAFEATGVKLEFSGAKIGITKFSWEAYLVLLDVKALSLKLVGLVTNK